MALRLGMGEPPAAFGYMWLYWGLLTSRRHREGACLKRQKAVKILPIDGKKSTIHSTLRLNNVKEGAGEGFKFTNPTSRPVCAAAAALTYNLRLLGYQCTHI
ncbi:hypothetical protein LNP05_29485, partial [Klebsiella pneumoniae subsp. pneumoniae]|nr:hypothetical protein [Klebsiella pneumoniae subsp. pneumoniae]